METLLLQQKQNVEELNKKVSNFARDSADRKSKKEYYERRIVRLAAWLRDFKEKHEALERFDYSNQPYARKKRTRRR